MRTNLHVFALNIHITIAHTAADPIDLNSIQILLQ